MTRLPSAFLMHAASPLHDPGWGHPEHQGRLRSLASAMARDMPALQGLVESVEPEEVGEDALLDVHTPAHVELVRSAAVEAAAAGSAIKLDEDTRVSDASWDAAFGSVAAAVTAARGVAQGRWANAFVATRPPGHHASAERAMGFCLFNSVAVTARRLQAEGLAERVLIVDWDVHHGNGTQDVFWEDPTVFYLSLHQYPYWPGTGGAGERGAGRGEGWTLNVPVALQTSRAEYLTLYHDALDAAFAAARPDVVLVSAGFDCMAGDPLGGLLLEPEDLHAMTLALVAGASEVCEGRIVACLEGGYDPSRTARGALSVVRALAGLGPLSETSSEVAIP